MVCADQDPKALLDVSAEEDFQAKLQEADFATAHSALTILRCASLHCSGNVLKPETTPCDNNNLRNAFCIKQHHRLLATCHECLHGPLCIRLSKQIAAAAKARWTCLSCCSHVGPKSDAIAVDIEQDSAFIAARASCQTVCTLQHGCSS